MSSKSQRLLWAVLLGVLFFLSDSVLPQLIGAGWTLILFAAVPFVVAMLFLGRAGRRPALRWGIVAAVVWYVILFWDIARLSDPPLPALIPLTGLGLATWTAISVQAYAAWKRASEKSS
jgi:hypothetical protein